MNIQAHIINEIGLQQIDERVDRLQELFQEVAYSHVPVGNGAVYMGCLSENDVESFEPEKKIGDYQHAMEGFYVRDTDDWLDVLDTFVQNDTNIMPVLDKSNTYLGFVELNDIMELFADTPFFSEQGGIIILEKGYKDYSFSEISQIVESNDAHILGAFLSKVENDLAQITVKVNVTSINALLQSFRRYGYQIVSHHQEDSFKTNLKERSDYLEKYLNI